MTIKHIILATAMAAVPMAAAAQSIGQRQFHEQRRINQGVRSGELTRHEARSLERGQMHIEREKRVMMADGYLSHGERAKLRHDERRQSQRIFQEKHDGAFRRY